MLERTLCIIKPDAVERDLTGAILQMIQSSGLTVKGLKMIRLTKAQAEAFYAVHKERPFFGSLTEYMSSGPVAVVALEADNAIKRYRDLMGATNPANAADGTIRKAFAVDVEKNSVHGSDAQETAAQEIPFFFNRLELVG